MVRVRLLGSLAIEVDGAAVDPPASRRAQALLAWLALHPGMHARGRLAGRFWPDVLDASARQSLRSAAWALRRALGPDGEGALRAMREEIGLDGVATDLADWDALVAAGRLEEALALERGDLLAGHDDDWVHEARDEHRVRLAEVLERLAGAAERDGDARGAVEWSRRWAALDPLAEAPARELMTRLSSAGDRSAALVVYARLRERLRLELGVSPGAATRAVAEAVRSPEPEQGPLPEPERDSGSGPLVGRSGELRRLERLRTGGRGGVIVLRGEGGIGKTRLATEVLNQAAADGARTAVCAALDIGGAAPFSLWAELLREIVRELPLPPPTAAWPGELTRLVPELGTAAAPPAPPELERARLFEATVALFEWASADRPLVVLADDLHLADPASIELAAYVGRRTPDMRAILLATIREAPRRSELDAALDALTRRGALLDDVRLGPMPAAEIEALMRAVAPIPDADVARLADIADGNALLAVESARSAASGERGPAAGLRASVRAQLGTLDDDARALAELLAVAGRDLDRRECAACGAHGNGLASAAADCGLLAAADGRIGYRHGLLRETVYEELPDPRRAWLHEQLADALAAAAEPGGGRRDAEVARHLLLAGSAARATAHLRRAAAHARGVAALPEAAGFLREALEIAPDDPGLWLELAEVEAWRNDRTPESSAAFDRVLDLIPAADQAALVDAWLRRARWFRGAMCVPHESLAAYRTALGLLDAAGMDAPRERAEAIAGSAWCEAIAGDVRVVDEQLARVHELLGGERPGDLLTHDVGAARQFALMRAGRFADSYAPGIAAGEAAQRAGRPDMAYGAWGNTASAAAAAGDLERALEFAERSLFAARGTGTPLQCVVLSAKSQILARMGRLDEARASAESQHELAERLDRTDLAAGADHDLAVIALAGGRHEAAADLFAAALAAGGPFSRPMARLARAEALARAGRPGEADIEVRAVTLEPVSPSDFPATLVARLARVQGIVALARGDRELAERRLTESAAGWRRHASPAADGAAYLANLVDLGRPAITGLVEPALELQKVEEELRALGATVP